MKNQETPIDALDLPSAIHHALASAGRECLTIERLQRKDHRELRKLAGLDLNQAKQIGYAITQYRIRTGQAGNGFNRYTQPGARILRVTLDDSEQALIHAALNGRAHELEQLLEHNGHDLHTQQQHRHEQTRIRWLLDKINAPRPSPGRTPPGTTPGEHHHPPTPLRNPEGDNKHSD